MGQDFHNDILRLGFDCNQKCFFCNVTPETDPSLKKLDFDAAKKRVDEIAATNPKTLSITGGEPTLWPFLVDLVAYAKSKGVKEVELQSNGVNLAKEDLVLRLKEAGLNTAFIAFHAPRADISDKITQAPGTWVRTVQGIKNMLKHGFKVTLNPVFNSYNYKLLPEYMEFIHEHFPTVSDMSISFVQPRAFAFKNDFIVPKMREVAPYIRKALEYAMNNNLPFFDPYCGLPLCYFDVPNLQERSNEYRESVVLRKSSHKIHHAVNNNLRDKKHGKHCMNCNLKNFCFGAWKWYAQIHGTDDLRPLRQTVKYWD